MKRQQLLELLEAYLNNADEQGELTEYSYCAPIKLRITASGDSYIEEYKADVYDALSETTSRLIAEKKISACDACIEWYMGEEKEL